MALRKRGRKSAADAEDLSEADKIIMISTIKQPEFSVLWNPRHAEHRSNKAKQKAWEKIAQQTGNSELVMKKVWKALTRRFKQELKKADQGGEEFKSTWEYFQTMMFYKENFVTQNYVPGDTDDEISEEDNIELTPQIRSKSTRTNEVSSTIDKYKITMTYFETLLPWVFRIEENKILPFRNEVYELFFSVLHPNKDWIETPSSPAQSPMKKKEVVIQIDDDLAMIYDEDSFKSKKEMKMTIKQEKDFNNPHVTIKQEKDCNNHQVTIKQEKDMFAATAVVPPPPHPLYQMPSYWYPPYGSQYSVPFQHATSGQTQWSYQQMHPAAPVPFYDNSKTMQGHAQCMHQSRQPATVATSVQNEYPSAGQTELNYHQQRQIPVAFPPSANATEMHGNAPFNHQVYRPETFAAPIEPNEFVPSAHAERQHQQLIQTPAGAMQRDAGFIRQVQQPEISTAYSEQDKLVPDEEQSVPDAMNFLLNL